MMSQRVADVGKAPGAPAQLLQAASRRPAIDGIGRDEWQETMDACSCRELQIAALDISLPFVSDTVDAAVAAVATETSSGRALEVAGLSVDP